MTFSSNDNVVLVAPRPVRLASGAAPFAFHPSPVSHRPRSRAALLSAATDAFDRLMLSEDSPDQQQHSVAEISSEKDSLSPRASPRSSGPTRALCAVSICLFFICALLALLIVGPFRATPTEALEEFLSILQHPSAFRFQPTSPVVRPSNAHFFVYRRQTPCSLSPSLPSEGLLADRADEKANDAVPYAFGFLGGSLGSPVSRMQSRNPLTRENGVVGLLRPASSMSPSPSSSLPPAAIPLPSPTPDEMEPEIVS
ncbi:hypothetical protein NUW54_g13502 [Trametes sanguinea]|uniref:Uncharacterized protein n=1 Tax=Trametes sanguinea TaxID=158606 RepID=A0ACC1MK99_9APHY|nr:hypothetical protein NUW54_g13502 [Trametes sanguinea]